MNFDVEAFVEDDFHAIRNFLHSLLDGAAWNAGQLADLVLAQNQVGSTVKVFPEEDSDDDPPDVECVCVCVCIR